MAWRMLALGTAAWRGKLLASVALAIGLLPCLVYSQPIPLLVSVATEEADSARRVADGDADAVLETLRQRPVGMSKQAAQQLQVQAGAGNAATETPTDLLLNLFPDTALLFRMRPRALQAGASGWLWMGVVEQDGRPVGEGILTRFGQALVGSFQLRNGEHYRLEIASDGVGNVRQLRFHGYAAGTAEDAVPVDADANGVVRPRGKRERQREPIEDAASRPTRRMSGEEQSLGGAVLDILLLFTTAAGGEDDNLRQALANTWVAETNEILRRSDAQLQLRLVGTAHSPWNDSGNSWLSGNYGNTLDALTGNGDGQLDFIHPLRDQVGADLVAMIVAPQRGESWTTVGRANLMDSNPASFGPFAFSVVHREFASGPSFTFAHEIGHNLGLAHDQANNPSSRGVRDSARGYQQKLLQPTFFTVMAYSAGCTGCQPIGYFSNPDVEYEMIPTGIRNQADAAEGMRYTGPFAAKWRNPPPPQPCTFQATGARPLPAAGAEVRVEVETQAGCQWTAASTASWLQVVDGATGKGPGTVRLHAARNPGTQPRNGSVLVAEQTLQFPQAALICTVEVTPRTVSIGNAASSIPIQVTVGDGCAFVSRSMAEWVVISGPLERVGSQTVLLHVGANGSGALRVGKVRIQGVEITVQQNGGATPCRVEAAVEVVDVSASPGQQTLAVLADPGCYWQADVVDGDFVSILDGGSGKGAGTVVIQVTPNPTAVPRVATISLGGKQVTVTQSGQPARCLFRASPPGADFTAAGGLLPIEMSAAPGCQWLVDPGATWIVPQGPMATHGQATLVFRIQQNTSVLSRQAYIQMGTARVWVLQAGVAPPDSCTYTVSHVGMDFSFQGGVQSLQVSTGANCPWGFDARGNWLQATPPTGTGPALLQVRTTENRSILPRGEWVRLGGHTVTVNQSALPLALQLWPSPQVLFGQTRAGATTLLPFPMTVPLGQIMAPLALRQPVVPWVREALPARDTRTPFRVEADAATLSAGVHQTTLQLSTSDGLATPVEVPVVVSVRSADSIRVSPQSLSFRAPRDSLPLSQWLSVWGASAPPTVEVKTLGGAWLRAVLYEKEEEWRIKVQPAHGLMAVGRYDAAIVVGCQQGCASVAVPVRFIVEPEGLPWSATPTGTAVASGGVVNAASFAPGIASGAWTSLFGRQLSTTTRGWQSSDFDGDRLPLSLDGVRVWVGGKPAAISFVSPGQVNFLAPEDLPLGWATVEVESPTGRAQAEVWVSEEAPGLFTVDGSHVAALHPDGVLARPGGAGVSGRIARPGDTLAVYGTGFGTVTTPPPPGRLVTQPSPLRHAATAVVTIGGVRASIVYIGLSGTGLNQLNVVVPALPSGVHAVELTLDGIPAQRKGTLQVEATP